MSEVKPLVIRQSLLGDVDICLRRAQYKIELPSPMITSAARAVGTAYHKALEVHYSEPNLPLEWLFHEASDCMKAELSGREVKWTDTLPDEEKCHQILGVMLKEYFEGGHAWPLDRYKVVGTEESFTVTQGDGSKFHGTIDLVLEDESGWVILVDHKTAGKAWQKGKSNPRKNNQSPFYTHFWKELHPECPGVVFMFDVMTYKGAFTRHPSISDGRHEDAVLKKAADFQIMYELVRGAGIDLPVNPSSNLCSPVYCDFWDVCPSGAALDVA